MLNVKHYFNNVLVATFIGLTSFSVIAESWVFDPKMLDGASDGADITLLNENVQLPGTYGVDIFINSDKVASRDVIFSVVKNQDGKDELYPCLTEHELSIYGIKTEKHRIKTERDNCVDMSSIPGASYDFMFNESRLVLTIPQVSLRKKEVGIAPKSLWDDGVSAILLNYNANFNYTENELVNGGSNHNSASYLQLNPGANLGAWRLRNQTNWSKNGNDIEGHWQTVYTYIDRGVNKLRSRLTLGDKSTPSVVFDSVPFRGIMLGSDPDMVPYNMRAFAPVVRGIAKTQARVEVKQNGYIIYSKTIAPGPFSLDDLTTSGSSSGDFQVTVFESDGTTQFFTIPYQTPAISVKEDYLAYNFMVGQYRPSDLGINESKVSQATIMYGLPYDLSIYSGAQIANHYGAITGGIGYSMGSWGALSIDSTFSQGKRKLDSDTERGSAKRIRYSKEFAQTNTSFTFGSYQFNSGKYNSLSDVLDTWQSHSVDDEYYRRKSNSYLSLSQSLGRFGYVSLNGSRTSYWNKPGDDNSYGISYGLSLLKDITMTLTWNETKQENINSSTPINNDLFSLWLNIPLGHWSSSKSNINATYQVISSSDEHQKQELGFNGDGLDNRLHWDIRQKFSPGSSEADPDNSNINLLWYGAYGQYGANYSYSSNMRQVGGSIAGGAVLHNKGLTLGQPFGETIALIEAPGAKGASIVGGRGVKTDMRGYTIDDALTPYQENVVSIDPLSLSDEVEINQTDVKVVPTSGSVVLAKFNPKIGNRVLMNLISLNGIKIPLGALVTVSGQDGNTGVVGLNQQVYLTGLPEKGKLLVSWTQGHCNVKYKTPEAKPAFGVYNIEATCL
ncbi:fimbria/pilus outer membrane usher protein [Aeromonas salmonicida]|uniref:fimbria/pilus outer membrane usher protein n=1 Tax=Aeromonas salmonicida TaxID=645 RepID=UPI0028611907|nr:fimbria/pilus outer membrane usher protein [Aeromonas salmonicida]MDR7019090.1 outer membrane usher protein [Aeromonas salmonicida]